MKGGGVDITLKNKQGKSDLELQGFTGEAKVSGSVKNGVSARASGEAAVFRVDAHNTWKIGDFKLTVGGNLTAISIGGHADISVTSKGVSLGAGASYLFGAGVKASFQYDPAP